MGVEMGLTFIQVFTAILTLFCGQSSTDLDFKGHVLIPLVCVERQGKISLDGIIRIRGDKLPNGRCAIVIAGNTLEQILEEGGHLFPQAWLSYPMRPGSLSWGAFRRGDWARVSYSYPLWHKAEQECFLAVFRFYLIRPGQDMILFATKICLVIDLDSQKNE